MTDGRYHRCLLIPKGFEGIRPPTVGELSGLVVRTSFLRLTMMSSARIRRNLSSSSGLNLFQKGAKKEKGAELAEEAKEPACKGLLGQTSSAFGS